MAETLQRSGDSPFAAAHLLPNGVVFAFLEDGRGNSGVGVFSLEGRLPEPPHPKQTKPVSEVSEASHDFNLMCHAIARNGGDKAMDPASTCCAGYAVAR